MLSLSAALQQRTCWPASNVLNVLVGRPGGTVFVSLSGVACTCHMMADGAGGRHGHTVDAGVATARPDCWSQTFLQQKNPFWPHTCAHQQVHAGRAEHSFGASWAHPRLNSKRAPGWRARCNPARVPRLAQAAPRTPRNSASTARNAAAGSNGILGGAPQGRVQVGLWERPHTCRGARAMKTSSPVRVRCSARDRAPAPLQHARACLLQSAAHAARPCNMHGLLTTRLASVDVPAVAGRRQGSAAAWRATTSSSSSMLMHGAAQDRLRCQTHNPWSRSCSSSRWVACRGHQGQRQLQGQP